MTSLENALCIKVLGEIMSARAHGEFEIFFIKVRENNLWRSFCLLSGWGEGSLKQISDPEMFELWGSSKNSRMES